MLPRSERHVAVDDDDYDLLLGWMRLCYMRHATIG